jgi:hypothetical protein
MSALGHSRPSHFVPVLNNVRYASDSNHSRYESELTLWAISGHGPVSFDYLIGDLVAPCRVDSGIPSNRDAKGEREGRC